MLSEHAPAKLNLALHVRQRRADGYHDIETLFAFVAFGDTLRAEPASDLSLTLSGPTASCLATTDNNLVLRAARLLQQDSGEKRGARFFLDKAIPVEAGLGGGSADAAAALRLLNRLWQLDWPLERLATLGAALGADVPACVHGRTMRGTGVGAALYPVPDGDIADLAVLLVNPGVAVPTGPVFRTWDGRDRGGLDAGPLLAVARAGRNDLEAPACHLAPKIAAVLACLKTMEDVRLFRMSGSGASCFALFDTMAQADMAHKRIVAEHPGWWAVVTRFQTGT